MGDALRQLKIKRPNFSLNANNLSFQAFVVKLPSLLWVQNGESVLNGPGQSLFTLQYETND